MTVSETTLAAAVARHELALPTDDQRFATRARALFYARMTFLLLGLGLLAIPSWAEAFGIRSHLAYVVYAGMLGYSVINYLLLGHPVLGRPITFVTLCADLLALGYLIAASGGLQSPLLATQVMFTTLFAILFPKPLAIVPPLLTLPVMARIDQILSGHGPVFLDLLVLVWYSAINAVVVYVIVFLNQREEAQRRELLSMQKEMKQLAVVEERNRLAREIHDGLGASLSSLILQAEYLEKLTLAPDRLEEMRGELGDLKGAAEEAIDELRRSLRMMRQDFNLVPALEEKCRSFGERARLEVAFRRQGLEVELTPEIQLTIFRVLQESLTNVAKHAAAKKVQVELTFREGALALQITDDGRGFAGETAPGHYGLLNLRERARRLAGEASVASELGRGTTVTLQLPLSAPEAPDVEPIKLLMVEDQAKILKSQLKLLSGIPELRLLGSALSGEEALSLIEQELPDVLLCDLGLPGISGIEVTRTLKARHPKIEVLIFTIFDEEERVLEAIRAGAAGYLLKGTPADKIVEAIKDVHAGGTVIQPSLARRLLRHFNAEGPRPAAPAEQGPALSERERQILELIAKGLSNREAGHALGISAGTVRTHLEHIYAKLEVTNRVEAVTEGIRKGLIDV